MLSSSRFLLDGLVNGWPNSATCRGDVRMREAESKSAYLSFHERCLTENMKIFALHLSLITIHFGRRIRYRNTGFDIVLPTMPGTGDYASFQFALAQRTSAVETRIINGIKSPVHIKNSDTLSINIDGLTLTRL